MTVYEYGATARTVRENAFVSLAVPFVKVAVRVTDALPSAKAGRVTIPAVETTLVLVELQLTFTPLLPVGSVMFFVTEVVESPSAKEIAKVDFKEATS